MHGIELHVARCALFTLIGRSPRAGAALGGVLGLVSAAAADDGGMLSGLVYPLHGGVGAIIGLFVALGVGVFLYVTRPR